MSRALLQAGVPPWSESRDVHPPLSAPTSLGLRALGAETAPAGGQDMPVGMRALPWPCPRPVMVSSSVQEMVYQATTKSLIKGVISGYNATVFAYGPTGEEVPR